jgi:hypothetical protein
LVAVPVEFVPFACEVEPALGDGAVVLGAALLGCEVGVSLAEGPAVFWVLLFGCAEGSAPLAVPVWAGAAVFAAPSCCAAERTPPSCPLAVSCRICCSGESWQPQPSPCIWVAFCWVPAVFAANRDVLVRRVDLGGARGSDRGLVGARRLCRRLHRWPGSERRARAHGESRERGCERRCQSFHR